MEGAKCAGANEYGHVWMFVDPYTQETDLLPTEHSQFKAGVPKVLSFRKKNQKPITSFSHLPACLF